MRLLIPLILWLPLAALAAEPPAARVAAVEPTCETSAPTFESNQVVCILPASTSERRWRLVMNFAGGHDDTIASLVVRLGDVADACDPDSKLRLMGEDGNVSLFCSFAVPAGSGRGAVLTSIVSWSHAQYSGYTLTPR